MTERRNGYPGVRRARLMVSAILLFSLVVILANHPWSGGEAPASTTGGIPAATTKSGVTTAAPTDATATPPVAERSLLFYPPVPLGEPGAAQPEMRRWPASGSVETVRDVDLAVYAGRSRTGKPLEGITVILDAGHGGIDSGCGYPIGIRNQDIMEKDVALSVVTAAKKELAELGARVLMIRDDDTFRSIFCRPAMVGRTILQDFTGLAERAGIEAGPIERLLAPLVPIIDANEDTFAGIMGGSGTPLDLKHVMDIQRQYPDWLFISVHCNASEYYPDARGLQVYYDTSEVVQHDERLEAQAIPSSDWQPSYQYYDDGGRLRIASLLYHSISTKVPALGNGTPSPLVDQDFAILREQNLVSAMIELGFLTNDSDREVLASADRRADLGEAIADAVYSFYCES